LQKHLKHKYKILMSYPLYLMMKTAVMETVMVVEKDKRLVFHYFTMRENRDFQHLPCQTRGILLGRESPYLIKLVLVFLSLPRLTLVSIKVCFLSLLPEDTMRI